MSDIKKFLDIVAEYSEEKALVEAQDSFDIELGEDLLIETGVVAITEDGIVVEGDEETLRLLAEHGVILEETDWSKYDEPTVSRIAKGVTKPVDRTDYNVPPAMRDKDQGKPGFEKRKSRIMKGLEKVGEGSADEPVHPDMDADDKRFDDLEESGLQAYLGKKKYGEEGMKALQKAGREGASKEKMAQIRAKHDKLDEAPVDKIEINGKPVNLKSLEVDGVDTRDYPEFGEAYLTYAEFEDGTPLSDEEIELFQDKHDDLVYQAAYDSLYEAEYQGRKVPLGKPMAGDVKKKKVYVRKPNGKVVKVNFGDKKMRIKKSNPKRRKSFRARHNCKNPGPRWKARYWSCRAW
jgi:hypothetical protein